ncbi:MAG: hypothetical protein ABSG26_24585, partial [Bryobacteraceae bacterium]
PPLYRPESMLHPPAETVNHHLLGAGEFSTGEMGNFQPALTQRPAHETPASRLVAALLLCVAGWP